MTEGRGADTLRSGALGSGSLGSAQRSMPPLAAYLTELGDDLLILGHRLSEWCGHGPTLEEDIALANIALDCLGQAEVFLSAAAEVEGAGRTADHLAFFREPREFRNAALVEQPNGDFAHTLVRQLLFDSYFELLLDALQRSKEPRLAALAERPLKETRYHLRHAAELTVRLGRGTEESTRRIETAVHALWRFTAELFVPSSSAQQLGVDGGAVEVESLRQPWSERIGSIFSEAGLAMPPPAPAPSYRAREGLHTEHLGHLLAVMQSTARLFPGAQW